MVLGGADTHDVRATDNETNFKSSKPSGLLDTNARQRQTGVYGELLWTPEKWTIGAGARIDHFSNFDARQWTSPPLNFANLPDFSETVFDPGSASRGGSQQFLSYRFGFSRLSRADAE